MKRDPYPLAWPDGWKRTPERDRKSARFDGSHFVRARDAVVKHLRLMGAVNGVITSDLPVKSNGMPYATGRAEDPGIAVWWVQPKIGTPGRERVIACDLYKTPGENLRAIEMTMNAMRGIDRWGASDLVERAFSGFTALPPGSDEEVNVQPATRVRPWNDVLDIDAALYDQITQFLSPTDAIAIVRSRHKALALKRHPDQGGTREAFEELNRALEMAEAEITG